MRITTFGGFVAAACMMAAFTATPSAAACCDDEKKGCCAEEQMACCAGENDPAAAAVIIPQLAPEARPAREMVAVWFTTPVKVGDRILFGKYFIEHDNDRMARGEPCTHIYAASDGRLPVVAFHCTHLDRPRAERALVVLASLGEANGMKELREFQFAGEVGAHGVPDAR